MSVGEQFRRIEVQIAHGIRKSEIEKKVEEQERQVRFTEAESRLRRFGIFEILKEVKGLRLMPKARIHTSREAGFVGNEWGGDDFVIALVMWERKWKDRTESIESFTLDGAPISRTRTETGKSFPAIVFIAPVDSEEVLLGTRVFSNDPRKLNRLYFSNHRLEPGFEQAKDLLDQKVAVELAKLKEACDRY